MKAVDRVQFMGYISFKRKTKNQLTKTQNQNVRKGQCNKYKESRKMK